MTNKKLEINAPEGYVIDQENSTFEKIVFKKHVPKIVGRWEDLPLIGGFYIGAFSVLTEYQGEMPPSDTNSNTCKTPNQAEGLIALAQLSQLYDNFIDGWSIEGDIGNITNYYYIDIKQIHRDSYTVQCASAFKSFLAFKTTEKAKQFINLHRELLITASVWF